MSELWHKVKDEEHERSVGLERPVTLGTSDLRQVHATNGYSKEWIYILSLSVLCMYLTGNTYIIQQMRKEYGQ